MEDPVAVRGILIKRKGPNPQEYKSIRTIRKESSMIDGYIISEYPAERSRPGLEKVQSPKLTICFGTGDIIIEYFI